MKRPPRLVMALLLTATVVIGVVILAPRFRNSHTLSGYIEGEPLFLATPVAGTVSEMRVRRGAVVKAGDLLFVIDPQQPRAQRDQAAADLAAAEAAAADARKGQRPVELAVFQANIAAAEAVARDANIQLRRIEILTRKGVYAQARLDDARATAQSANARVAAARHQHEAAALGSRQDEIRAADARVAQAQAALTGATARLADVAPRAPAASRVEDVFYQQGEWVAANQPILSLLPDERVTLRFFVPEASLSAYRIGRVVRFSCDGCAGGLKAKIAFVSPRPEFTPPVIYSREARDRLVYLVEARPSVRLNPGQPVDVSPLEPDR
jgi:HlyD family secretion protein